MLRGHRDPPGLQGPSLYSRRGAPVSPSPRQPSGHVQGAVVSGPAVVALDAYPLCISLLGRGVTSLLHPPARRPSAPGTAQRGRNPCLCSEGEASTCHTCYGKVGKQEGCLSSHVVPRGLPFCDTEPGILGGGGHRVPNLDQGAQPLCLILHAWGTGPGWVS